MTTYTLFFSDTEVYNFLKLDRLKSLLKLLENNGEDLTDFSFMNNGTFNQYEGDHFNLTNIPMPEKTCNLLQKVHNIANGI